jgi:hypothetical protein
MLNNSPVNAVKFYNIIEKTKRKRQIMQYKKKEFMPRTKI